MTELKPENRECFASRKYNDHKIIVRMTTFQFLFLTKMCNYTLMQHMQVDFKCYSNQFVSKFQTYNILHKWKYTAMKIFSSEFSTILICLI